MATSTRNKSIRNSFDTNGSRLAVPVSPADGTINNDISMQGKSRLHNEYSNIGDPSKQRPAYNNMGSSAMGYSTPSTSLLGKEAQAWQGKTNRYSNNLPAGASF